MTGSDAEAAGLAAAMRPEASVMQRLQRKLCVMSHSDFPGRLFSTTNDCNLVETGQGFQTLIDSLSGMYINPPKRVRIDNVSARTRQKERY